MDRNTGIKVYIVAVICTVTTGFSFLGVKTALAYASPLESLFFRFAVAFFFALILVGFKVVKTDLKNKKLVSLLAPAALYSVGFFGFQYFGLCYSSSIEAGIIMSIQPAIAMILAELTIKEKSNIVQRLCVFTAIIAAAFISSYRSGGVESVDIRGIILLFLSALSMAGNVVFIRWIRKDYTPAEISFVSCAFGFIIYTAVILILGSINGTLEITFSHITEPEFVIAILYLGIVCTMLTTLMNSYMMKYIEAVKASVLGCAGTIITLMAGFFILHEDLSVMQIICALIIIVAVIGTNYFGGKKNE